MHCSFLDLVNSGNVIHETDARGLFLLCMVSIFSYTMWLLFPLLSLDSVPSSTSLELNTLSARQMALWEDEVTSYSDYVPCLVSFDESHGCKT